MFGNAVEKIKARPGEPGESTSREFTGAQLIQSPKLETNNQYLCCLGMRKEKNLGKEAVWEAYLAVCLF